jgi:hypothetical protein
VFTFRLERPDGTAAEPPTFRASVPDWKPGDTIPLGASRMLRVVETRFADDELVLVVEDAEEIGSLHLGYGPHNLA